MSVAIRMALVEFRGRGEEPNPAEIREENTLVQSLRNRWETLVNIFNNLRDSNIFTNDMSRGWESTVTIYNDLRYSQQFASDLSLDLLQTAIDSRSNT